MGIPPGSIIGPYTIETEIGRGAMGVVYLARDTRLERNVAIKAIPEHLANIPGRLQRFETEARALARLNHPNVASIHGLEEEDGQRFLVLEYVPGESLAERLKGKGFTEREAIDTCLGIAKGVEAAHEAGIIHRDLKPDNIRLTPEGTVKVLDFGLARTAEGENDEEGPGDRDVAATLTTPDNYSPTLPGAVIGTAAYMSPEQARGEPVDRRSDIWSFGVLLFECLAGKGPFGGKTAADSLGAVLHKEIDFGLLPAGTSPLVHHVLRGCLVRDRDKRFRDIGDLRLQLESIDGWEETVPQSRLTGPNHRQRAALVVAGLVMGALAGWLLKPGDPQPTQPVADLEINLPAGKRLAHLHYPGLAISPDGETIAYLYGDEPDLESRRWLIPPAGIMIRRLDQAHGIPLPGLDSGATEIVFAPDGERIAYWADGAIFQMPVLGGRPRKILDIAGTTGQSWGDDDRIVAGGSPGLVQFPAAGGVLDTLTRLNPEEDELSHRLPFVLPGSDVILFTVLRFGNLQEAPGKWSVWAYQRSTAQRKRLVEQATDGRFVNGHLIFLREGALFAAEFDPARLELKSEPRLVLEGIQHSIFAIGSSTEIGTGHYAVSSSGTLVFAPGDVNPEMKTDVVLVDQSGQETLVEIESRQYLNRFGSPNGSEILLSSYYAPTSNVWVHDLDRGITRPQRLVGTGLFAAWGPGPDTITFDRVGSDGRSRFFIKPTGGSDEEEQEIALPDDIQMYLAEWSDDGRYLFGVDRAGWDLWYWTEEGGWAPILKTAEVFEGWPTLSPDGRWLAYGARESGRFEVFVRPFPGPGGAVQVTRYGGRAPVWSHDGSELFIRGRDAEGKRWIMGVGVGGSSDRPEIGPARNLFEDIYEHSRPIRCWDILADGNFIFGHNLSAEDRRLRMEATHADRLRVIQNWTSQLD